MSAIVTSPEDEDWYINNRGWSIIMERAMRDLDPAEREMFENYAGPIGLNFRSVEPAERPLVARWLLRAVEALAGPEAAEQGWDSDESRAHLEEVAVMVRPIAQG